MMAPRRYLEELSFALRPQELTPQAWESLESLDLSSVRLRLNLRFFLRLFAAVA